MASFRSLLILFITALSLCAVLLPILATHKLSTPGAEFIESPRIIHTDPPRLGKIQHDAKHKNPQQFENEKNIEAPVPLPRKCTAGACAPRRYFATTNQDPPMYYLEPNLDSNGRNGMYSSIPSRPWDESSISPLDLYSENAADLVRKTMQERFNNLVESDLRWNTLLPKYLPPQFPQWDRSVHLHIVSEDATVLGMPPECCPGKTDLLSEEELNDCKCRSPRNYPDLGNVNQKSSNGPIATLVTAFYQTSSKDPVNTKLSLLVTSDPMIIFCDPKSIWVDYAIEGRKHAPTIVVPMTVSEFHLKHNFRETFRDNQYDIDPESPTHHEEVDTRTEKLVMLESAATLNPFNTTQFFWVDADYFKDPWPHLHRKSAVMINTTKEGVNDESTLMVQMTPCNFELAQVVNGEQALVGGNIFGGTYNGISHFYSAFYETFWAMAATGKYVGSDDKVMSRTCHTYPTACHIHKPRKWRHWQVMLEELLTGIGPEMIQDPLKLEKLIPPEENLHLPPNGAVGE